MDGCSRENTEFEIMLTILTIHNVEEALIEFFPDNLCGTHVAHFKFAPITLVDVW